tara:strand:+ start:284 stop:535 length:252 start_codon:yes stop_codon:yes gene_type:complete
MKDTRSYEEIQAANLCLKTELKNAIAFFKSENYYGLDIRLLHHMANKNGRALLKEIERLEKRNETLQSLYDFYREEMREWRNE